MEAIAVVFLFLGITIPLVLLRGWVLSVLWGWFVVTIFHLPPLGIAQAIGISIVITTFFTTTAPNTDKKRDWWEPLIEGFIAPLMGLGMGFIVKQFV
jgi:hypothetical protein